MAIRNTRKAPVAAAGIVGFTAEQAATLRTGINAALGVDKKKRELEAVKINATDILIAGMANAALLAHRFEFQARDRKGNVTETKYASLYEYARNGAPFFKADGTPERARQSGFKAAILAFAAGINDASTPAANSAWTLIKGKALPVAIALADNTIAATLAGNKLTLSGGNGSTVASGLIDAAKKSTSALVGKVTAKGTNKPKLATPAKPAAPAAVVLDTEAAMRAALAYLIKVAAGDEAISNKRISLLKGIAKAAADIIAQEAAAAKA